jgi:cytochrome c553
MENGGVAGLPADYIVQQLADFKSGARKSADSRKANTNEMIAIAKALTDAEAKAAADYFASMAWRPWTKVVESDTAPKVRSTINGLFIPLEGGATEPLGQRIIEVPVNPERTEIQRDPRSGFVAYVPPGSIARGEALVTTGGGKTMTCGICHGENLKGVANVPGIAGRSTSYLVRQLYDMQKGTRNGAGAALMGAAVANLSEDDMIAIAAYVASRPVN